MKFPALAIAALSFLALIPAAHAGKFKLKNCLKERVIVCAYNGNDSSLAAPAEVRGIKPGKKEGLKCATKRCKVFAAVSKLRPADYTEDMVAAGGAMGGTAATLGIMGATAAGTVTVAGAVATGGAVVAGVAVGVGVVKGIEKLDHGAACKRIIKRARKNKNAINKKASGKFTLKAVTVEGKVRVYLEKGHTSCGG